VAKIADKSKKTQKDADERARLRKAAGRARIADALSAYHATMNLPNRKDIYNVETNVRGKKGAIQYTGANVRTAIFNMHLHPNNEALAQPKIFQNRLQGPAGEKTQPIPTMQGTGLEFPLSQKRGGYKDPRERPGPARAIMQPIPEGHKFLGVVAHDASRRPSQPGHMDHFLVHPQAHA